MELDKNNKKTADEKIKIPEGSAEFVENLLEKFDLKEEQEKGIEKLFQVSDVKEREKIFEQLPGRKIALLIRKYAFGEIDLKRIKKASLSYFSRKKIKKRKRGKRKRSSVSFFQKIST